MPSRFSRASTSDETEELGVIESGRIHYRDVDINDVSARVIGDTAILLTDLVLGAVVDGNEVSNPFVVTEVYVAVDGSWAFASMSFTRLSSS